MIKRCIFVSVLCSLAISSVCAKSVKFPLEYKAFADAREPAKLHLGRWDERSIIDDEKPDGSEAAVGVNKFYYSFRMAGMFGDSTIHAVLSNLSGAENEYDHLWIDWDGDNLVSARETYVAKRRNGTQEFGPILYAGPNAVAGIRFFLTLSSRNGFEIAPACMHVGIVQFGPRKVKVALFDANTNGTYSDAPVQGVGDKEIPGDMIAIDLNGDGKFQAVASANLPEGLPRSEMFPASGIVQVPGAGYFKITPATDGSYLSVEPYAGSMGRLRIVGAEATLDLKSKNGAIRIHAPAGLTALPASNYTFANIVLTKRDKNGKAFILTLTPDESKPLIIAANKTQILPYGPPYKLTMSTERNRNQVSITVQLADRSGTKLVGPYTDALTNAPAPQLRITRDGKQVFHAKFAYG